MQKPKFGLLSYSGDVVDELTREFKKRRRYGNGTPTKQ